MAVARPRWAGVAAFALFLAGCGEDPVTAAPDSGGVASNAAEGPTAQEPTADSVDAAGLVGSWTVEAEGEQPGAVLRIGDDLTLWKDCGVLRGMWRAVDGGLFAASMDGASGDCPFGANPTPGWLASATRFVVRGETGVLLDGDSETVATLRPGGTPTPPSSVSPDLAEPPELTPEFEEALAAPAPLPDGLPPASRDDLVGRWVPPNGAGAGAPERPHVLLAPDGGWTGSDGCNSMSGRWTAGDDGLVVASTGGSTDIGCDEVNVPDWFAFTSRAGLDGSALVLLDLEGKELGRLVRDS